MPTSATLRASACVVRLWRTFQFSSVKYANAPAARKFKTISSLPSRLMARSLRDLQVPFSESQVASPYPVSRSPRPRGGAPPNLELGTWYLEPETRSHAATRKLSLSSDFDRSDQP